MIYLISDGLCVKIGKSKYPLQRLKNLQTSNHRLLRLEYVYKINDSFEKKLHELFKDYKTESNNEWFDFSKIDLNYELRNCGIKEVQDITKAKFEAEKLNNIKASKEIVYEGQLENRERNISKKKKNNKNKKNTYKKLVPNETQVRIKFLLKDINEHLEYKKNQRISYYKYTLKYNFTKEEISYFIKSAKLSTKVSLHNGKLG